MISRANPRKAREILGWQAIHSIEDVVCFMVESEMMAVNSE
jgi:GDP-D-mannose dehydratase